MRHKYRAPLHNKINVTIKTPCARELIYENVYAIKMVYLWPINSYLAGMKFSHPMTNNLIIIYQDKLNKLISSFFLVIFLPLLIRHQLYCSVFIYDFIDKKCLTLASIRSGFFFICNAAQRTCSFGFYRIVIYNVLLLLLLLL